jgi:hypothetical protein
MSSHKHLAVVENPLIENQIYLIRGQKVMVDSDLAKLYGVPTKSINLAVQRNSIRFPSDFMFRLTFPDIQNLRFQIETSSWGGRRYLPYVFTEQGVAMLSSVLKSQRAAIVNIAIMRAFVKLRNILLRSKNLAKKINDLENTLKKHDARFKNQDDKIKKIFDAIRKLMNHPPTRPIDLEVIE